MGVGDGGGNESGGGYKIGKTGSIGAKYQYQKKTNISGRRGGVIGMSQWQRISASAWKIRRRKNRQPLAQKWQARQRRPRENMKIERSKTLVKIAASGSVAAAIRRAVHHRRHRKYGENNGQASDIIDGAAWRGHGIAAAKAGVASAINRGHMAKMARRRNNES